MQTWFSRENHKIFIFEKILNMQHSIKKKHKTRIGDNYNMSYRLPTNGMNKMNPLNPTSILIMHTNFSNYEYAGKQWDNTNEARSKLFDVLAIREPLRASLQLNIRYLGSPNIHLAPLKSINSEYTNLNEFYMKSLSSNPNKNEEQHW